MIALSAQLCRGVAARRLAGADDQSPLHEGDGDERGAAATPGDWVEMGIASADRDEAVYEDPDTFRLDSPPTSQSSGLRRRTDVCPGATLARMEGTLAVEELPTAWPGWSPCQAPPTRRCRKPRASADPGPTDRGGSVVIARLGVGRLGHRHRRRAVVARVRTARRGLPRDLVPADRGPRRAHRAGGGGRLRCRRSASARRWSHTGTPSDPLAQQALTVATRRARPLHPGCGGDPRRRLRGVVRGSLPGRRRLVRRGARGPRRACCRPGGRPKRKAPTSRRA